MEGSREHGNEPSGSRKFWEILEWLRLLLLKTDSAARSWLVSYLWGVSICLERVVCGIFREDIDMKCWPPLSPDHTVIAFKSLVHSWRFHGKFDPLKGSGAQPTTFCSCGMKQEAEQTEGIRPGRPHGKAEVVQNQDNRFYFSFWTILIYHLFEI
jgi:hypothetical protein